MIGQVMSLEEVFGTEELWQYGLSFSVILVITFFVPYHWLPESPKYLYIIKKKRDEAINEIQRLGGRKARDDYVKQQIEAIRNEEALNDESDPEGAEQSTKKQRSLWSVITDSTLTLPLILVCALQGGQQLSGINAVDEFFELISITHALNFYSCRYFSTQFQFLNPWALAQRVPNLQILALAVSIYSLRSFHHFLWKKSTGDSWPCYRVQCARSSC